MQVFLAHLSADCNRPELALRTVVDALQQRGHDHIVVKVAHRQTVSEVWVRE